jgi:hypothetical protein
VVAGFAGGVAPAGAGGFWLTGPTGFLTGDAADLPTGAVAFGAIVFGAAAALLAPFESAPDAAGMVMIALHFGQGPFLPANWSLTVKRALQLEQVTAIAIARLGGVRELKR